MRQQLDAPPRVASPLVLDAASLDALLPDRNGPGLDVL